MRGMMKKVYLYVIITAFLFGTMEVGLKMAGNQLDAFQLTFIRFMLGGGLLLIPALADMKKTGLRLNGKDWQKLLALGIVCIPISMVLFQFGVQNSNASTAAVLFCVNPLFTMVLAHFFANEPMSRRKGVAFILGLLGILAMMKPWDIQPGNTLMGMSFSLLAALFFSIYSIMGKHSIKRLGPFVQTSFSFFLGSAVLLIIILMMGKPVLTGVLDEWQLVLYVGFFVTGLGYLFYFLAMRGSNATTASVAFFIKPVIAPIMAAIILSEAILWNTYLGIAFILVASYVQMTDKPNNLAATTKVA
jgi:drug/metabolite transporter (DMT)-like permease